MRERSDKCFTVATRRGLLKLLAKQWRVLAIVALVAASLASSPKRPYTPHEKAFYADDATVEFVQPGLTITINSAAIAANGTITVTYTLDGSQWFAVGCGRSDHAGHDQPELRGRGAAQRSGRLYGVYHEHGDRHGDRFRPAAGRGFGRHGCVVGPGQYQYTFPHRSAYGIRRDRHAYHRHLWIAKL